MPIALVPYDPRWPAFFELERGQIIEAFADDEIVEVNHIGSTAVPGLSAKPVIDIQVAVPTLMSPDAYGDLLGPLGYVLGESGENDRRILFHKHEPQDCHLHIVKHGNSAYQRHIRFRDALREDPELVREYEQLKHQLARQTDDRREYSELKTDFIDKVLSTRSDPGVQR